VISIRPYDNLDGTTVNVFPSIFIAAVGGFLGKSYFGNRGLGIGIASGLLLGYIAAKATMTPVGNTFKTFNGRSYLIHVPEGSSGKKLVYFHGNGAKIDDLWDSIASFDKANDPRILIIPQLEPQGSIPKADLLGILDELGVEEMDALAHSGGFVALAMLLNTDKRVSNVGLFDALYGSLDTFERFAKRNFLVNIYGPTTRELSQQMVRDIGNRANAEEYLTGNHGGVPIRYGEQVINMFDEAV